jgi:hypothetical protein
MLMAFGSGKFGTIRIVMVGSPDDIGGCIRRRET